MRDRGHIESQEVINIVILAVHIENEVYFFGGDQEPLSVILSDSGLDEEVNQYLLIKGLVVVPVPIRLQMVQLVLILVLNHFYCLLFERQLYQLVVTLLQKLQRIFVSQLNCAKLSQDLRVNYPQVVIHGLVKYFVIYLVVDHLANGPQALNSIQINLLEHA